MESIPAHSRIVIIGYRLMPSCRDKPLLNITNPERHWALLGAVKNGLIVLNDYQANTSHFPFQQSTSLYANIVNEVRETDGGAAWPKKRAAWREVLKNDPNVDYVVSWGAPRTPYCGADAAAPFGAELNLGYEKVFSNQRASRVQIWKRRR